ncbi:hypothetical protein F8M41_021606 [Gigaspora margarita]|uniref:Uncharacterized protein n=1 Tax=Gigaspora margarita TaxID=4874 RepID=A0A8H4AGI2_GIGMA|nr:hypothetical protein F8M41_021606 [Gigaspora margarita]
MKNNLKKTVLSVIGHLKIGSKKFSHILASNIEWTYVSNDSSPLIQKGASSAKTAYTEQILLSNNLASTSQNRSQYISSCITRIEDEKDATFISDDDPAELVQVRIQEATPETKNKRVKNLRSAKK